LAERRPADQSLEDRRNIMRDSVVSGSRGYWGWRGSTCLFCNWNCAEATVQTTQDMISRQEDALIKASSGLEGGVVSAGSTCGVVSGGALSLALMHDEELREGGLDAEVALLSVVGDYVDWFSKRYGSAACRERSGVDFATFGGLIRYFLPPDPVLRCLWHINGAMRYLYDSESRDLPVTENSTRPDDSHPIHCAQEVLRGVRERTGVGDPLLERLSVVLDGGVGLRGGACGALAGAIMAVNIPMGINLRDASIIPSAIAFFAGQGYVRSDNADKIDEPYAAGNRIARGFRAEAGSTDCSDITGVAFSDWTSFQHHVASSETCHRLIDLSVGEAASAIEQYQRAS
jgi:hypothetical protein